MSGRCVPPVVHQWATGDTIIPFTSGKTTVADWWQNASGLAVVNVSGPPVAHWWQKASGIVVARCWWPISGKTPVAH